MFLFLHLECNFLWDQFEHSCYRVFQNNQDWFTARDLCLLEDADLASIHSAAEQEFIRNLGLLVHTSSMWIGGKMGVNDFEWDDGSEFNYDYWSPNEPDHNGECIVELYNDSGDSVYEWFDEPCTGKYYYVCKKDAT